MKTTGIVILAAGASSRLGEPKQNLEFRGKSLLNHAIDVALESKCNFIVVVTGAFNYDVFIPANGHSGHIKILQNPLWQEGIASSIRLGLTYLQDNSSHLKEVIFMVCDQPFVNSDLLNSLLNEKYASGKHIVACAYQNTLGTPVLFDKSYFEILKNVKGDEGAKKIVFNNMNNVEAIPFPYGYLDIDTKQDYDLLLKLEEDKRFD